MYICDQAWTNNQKYNDQNFPQLAFLSWFNQTNILIWSWKKVFMRLQFVWIVQIVENWHQHVQLIRILFVFSIVGPGQWTLLKSVSLKNMKQFNWSYCIISQSWQNFWLENFGLTSKALEQLFPPQTFWFL